MSSKLSAITPSVPIGKDVIYRVDNSTGTPASASSYLPDAAALGSREGTLVNGYVNVTVSSNNITVAIKALDGTNPSSTNPVVIKIGTSFRRITSSLSVTLNAGTNWFNSGAAAHATFEQNYFVYLSYRTASSAVVVGFGRIPYARLYSDFSTTSTAEKYGAFSTAPASTDAVVNIGRFAATLSASASYNWSVPTFTASNLLQFPIYESEFMTWAPAPTGFSAVPTNTVYNYRFVGKEIVIRYREQANGTSNATTFTATAPFTALTMSNMVWQGLGSGVDNGSGLTTAVLATISSASATINFFASPSPSGTAWTNANGKRVGFVELRYSVA